MTKNNIIPIGGDCSVALLLKELELRESSYPFDWVTCSFNTAISLIDNNFSNFIDIEHLIRDKRITHQHVYHSDIYNLGFFHDFNQMEELSEQEQAIKEKYNRRIKRFYESLESGTTLIRLLTNDNDLNFYIYNKDKIKELVRSYNINNKIIVCRTLDEIKEYLKEQ